MRGGVLPPALLFAALAFMLAFAPRRALLPALIAAAAVALVVSRLEVPAVWTEAVFVGCWLSVVVTAALIHLRRGTGVPGSLALAVNAGAWAGATTAVAGTSDDLLKALPVALLALPGQILVARRGGIAVKVLASWLVAVAVLAGMLATVPTPGYVQDHMQ